MARRNIARYGSVRRPIRPTTPAGIRALKRPLKCGPATTIDAAKGAAKLAMPLSLDATARPTATAVTTRARQPPRPLARRTLPHTAHVTKNATQGSLPKKCEYWICKTVSDCSNAARRPTLRSSVSSRAKKNTAPTVIVSTRALSNRPMIVTSNPVLKRSRLLMGASAGSSRAILIPTPSIASTAHDILFVISTPAAASDAHNGKVP